MSPLSVQCRRMTVRSCRLTVPWMVLGYGIAVVRSGFYDDFQYGVLAVELSSHCVPRVTG